MSDSRPDEQWRQNVAAVILDAADDVLLGSTAGKSPYWHFPQGGVGKEESLREAVLREVWEEVGIPPADCTILASYGGLRYTYRHKNKKSERWIGQEQTYFLIRCEGIQPVASVKTQSDEFAELRWVPWRQLTADMFVPFKREAIIPALEAFFPRGCADISHVASRLSPLRYAYAEGKPLSQHPSADKSLFGGGKAAMVEQMADLTRRFNTVQRRIKRDRLLVLLVGLPGSGLTNALRRLARCMDPLHTHAVQPRKAEEAVLPAAGECTLLNVTPHAVFLSASPDMSPVALQATLAQEATWKEQGVQVLKIFLHVSHAEHSERSETPLSAQQWQAQLLRAETLLQYSSSPESPWYIIPADCRWYRDFVVATLIAETLEHQA